MLFKRFVKKAITVCVYVIVLQYLLPFISPAYLYSYYVAGQKASGSSPDSDCKKCTKLLKDKSLIKDYHTHHFPKKGKGRFDLGNSVSVPFVFDQFAFQNKKVTSSYLQILYSTPLILCNSNRGPPIA